MSKKIKLLGGTVIAATIIVAAAACAEDEEKKKELTLDSVQPVARDIAPVTKISVGPGMQRLVDLAMTDLTTKLNIEAEDVVVVQAEYVTWRDSSAGCPQPDMQYMQVLTNGSRMAFKAKGAVHHYHTGGNRPPFYCAKPSKQGPLPFAHGET